jgi:WD40 repeat protein
VALLTLVVCLSAVACDGFRAPPPAPSGPCALARKQRERILGLLNGGKLDRAVRVIRRADALCPGSARESSVALVETLTALGRWADVNEAAEQIEADRMASPEVLAAVRAARAKVADLAKSTPETEEAHKRGLELFEEASDALDAGNWDRAEEKFLAAWRERRPDGRALFGAGLAAKRKGDKPGAQRLFDQALVELERRLGSPVKLEMPNGVLAAASIAWSPNGKVLAVAAYEYVSVLDAATLRERMRLAVPGSKFRAVAWSPNGKALAACSSAGEELHVWDLESGEEPRRFAKRWSRTASEGVNVACRSVAWSPDGQRLATPLDSSVQLWDLASGQGTNALDGRAGRAQAVAWSPDGATIALGTEDGAVILWDVASSKEVGRLGNNNGGLAVAFTPDGKMLATGGSSGTVMVWEVASRRLVHKLKGHSDDIKSLAWSPDGKLLASNSGDTTLRLWDVGLGEEIRQIRLDGTTETFLYTLGVAWSPDGRTVAAGNMVGTLSLWTLDSGKPRSILAKREAISSVSWSPDGKALLLGSRDRLSWRKTWRTWDLVSGKQSPLEGELASGVFDPASKTIASHGIPHGAPGLQLWEAASGKLIKKLGEQAGAVSSIALSPDGKALAAGYDGGTVRLWDAASGDEIRKLLQEGGPFDTVYAVAWSPDGRTIAAACKLRAVCLWNAASGDAIRRIEVGDYVARLVWSPDSKALAAGPTESGGSVHILDVGSRNEINKLGENCGNAVAWSPDGKTLAGTSSKTVRLWDVASRNQIRALEGHDSTVMAVAWSPDGKTLVSGSEDGMMRFWNLAGFGADAGSGFESVVAVPMRGGGTAYVATASAHPLYELLGDGARDLAVCRVGVWSFPIDLCEERFVVPGLLQMVMKRDASYLEP